MVQGNIQVMSEMLIAVTPGEENPDDRELLKVMFLVHIQSLGILHRTFEDKMQCIFLERKVMVFLAVKVTGSLFVARNEDNLYAMVCLTSLLVTLQPKRP